MLVDFLSSDFYLNFGYDLSEGGDSRSSRLCELKVHARDKVTVAADGARYLCVFLRGTVEGLLDAFHREVGVASVDNLEVGDLWIAG